MKARNRDGRIITFYSYKGGTGRSMAVANVGWLLASAGKRVLLIDWDFEAPGLHRYLHPFLDDPDLRSTQGLIDFFVAFAAAARDESGSSGEETWFEPLASLLPFTVPVKWDGFGDGTLELVPAGRQDAAYPVRVTSFDWQHLYEHGGGIFLEAVKRQLRADYDFILIDSRTGISDTAGICTVQMPDELVVLFTLNRQSIGGASAVAESADQQRRKEDGRSGLKIWPVPTRVELAEKERLEAARDTAKLTFDKFLAYLPREARNDHWNRIQVLYQPYYAYEEVLAAFGDSRKTPASMLAAMEEIAALLTLPEPLSIPRIPERVRREKLAQFERKRSIDLDAAAAATTPRGRVFVSYSRRYEQTVMEIVDIIAKAGIDVWIDRLNLRLGDDFAQVSSSAFEDSSVILYFIGPAESPSSWRQHELSAALSMNKVIIPVLINDAGFDALPEVLQTRQAAVVRNAREDLWPFINELREVLEPRLQAASAPFDPDDPQKGRWGGLAKRNGRELSATVMELSGGLFQLTLLVSATTGAPLTGNVEFHLHPTFAKPVIVKEAVGGMAKLTLKTWGAFTVGAVADDGRTTLELDLAANKSFPAAFREH